MAAINPEVRVYLLKKFAGEQPQEEEGFDNERLGASMMDTLNNFTDNQMRIYGATPGQRDSQEARLLSDRKDKRSQRDKAEADRDSAARALYGMDKDEQDREDAERRHQERRSAARAAADKKRPSGGGSVGTPKPKLGRPVTYTDAEGNERRGMEYPDQPFAPSPTDPITKPYRPSIDESKQAGLVEMGDMANTQYSKAIKKGKDGGDYDPTDPYQFIDNSDWLPSWVKSDAANEARSAESAWVESYLRDASGAAIPPSEREAYARDFFPRPGDSADVVKNKETLRRQKEDVARSRAGKAAPKAPPTTFTDEQVLKFMKANSITNTAEAVKLMNEEVARRNAANGG